MARLETVSSVAAKQRRRFLPHALFYPFRIFKLGKSDDEFNFKPWDVGYLGAGKGKKKR